MKDSEHRAEIERLEEWFRGVCAASGEVERSAIRRGVRMAIEEQWLATQLVHGAPEELVTRAKGRVREALHERASEAGTVPNGARRALRSAWWLGGGLSAAAAVGLAFLGLRTPGPGADVGETPVSFAAVFERFEDDDFDAELASLREALLAVDERADDWSDFVDADGESSYDGA